MELVKNKHIIATLSAMKEEYPFPESNVRAVALTGKGQGQMEVDFSQKEYHVKSPGVVGTCGGGYHTESEREGAHNQAERQAG